MSKTAGGRGRSRGWFVLVVLVAAPGWPAAAAADTVPGAVWTEHHLRSKDGTSLHADVFRPAAALPGKRLLVLLVVARAASDVPAADDRPPKGVRG